MNKINVEEIKEDPWQSPKGKFAVAFRGISEALGRDPESLDLTKRWPFDLEWNRMPPGKSNFPMGGHIGAVGNVFDRERQRQRAR
jgi:hypothetical protein